jgi:hypothetical protein
MSRLEKSLRQQVEEARANIERQIEILWTARNYRGCARRTTDTLTVKLTATLKPILF